MYDDRKEHLIRFVEWAKNMPCKVTLIDAISGKEFKNKEDKNLQEQIRKVLMEEFPQEDYSNEIIKNVAMVDSVIRTLYPNFNKDDVYMERRFPIGWSIPLDCYFDIETNLKYASIYKKKRELILNKEIYGTLENYLNEDVATYVIDWFNNEFDTNAEYVTF
jgi:hypothetical protein